MFKGLGKFSLLLAGAALLVVSCGQPDLASSTATGVAGQTGRIDRDSLILPETVTADLVRVARSHPNVKVAENALKRSGMALDWNGALGVNAHLYDKPEDLGIHRAIGVESQDGSVQVYIAILDQGRFSRKVAGVTLVRTLATSPSKTELAFTTVHAGEGFVYLGEVSKPGNSARVIDWGPRIGTKSLEELTTLGPAGSHHPEIPSDPGTCNLPWAPQGSFAPTFATPGIIESSRGSWVTAETAEPDCKALKSAVEKALEERNRQNKDALVSTLPLASTSIGACIDDPNSAACKTGAGAQTGVGIYELTELGKANQAYNQALAEFNEKCKPPDDNPPEQCQGDDYQESVNEDVEEIDIDIEFYIPVRQPTPEELGTTAGILGIGAVAWQVIKWILIAPPYPLSLEEAASSPQVLWGDLQVAEQ